MSVSVCVDTSSWAPLVGHMDKIKRSPRSLLMNRHVLVFVELGVREWVIV